MPIVRIRSEDPAGQGGEQILTEYLCDWPDCPSIADDVKAVVRELGITLAYCQAHADEHRRRDQRSR
jgi:hypothetical protein